jgi:hypothetical protein
MKKKYDSTILGNPSIEALMFNKRDERWFNFVSEAQRRGIVIREVFPVDISFDIHHGEEKFNKQVEFIRENLSPILKRFIPDELKIMGFDIKKKAFEKLKGLEEFDYKNCVLPVQKKQPKYFGHLGLTPFLVDTHLLQAKELTKEQKEMIKCLKSLSVYSK